MKTTLLLLTSAFLAIPLLHAQEQKITRAIAVLHPTQNQKASGTITFTATGDGIHVAGTVTGLTPGKHGFHIHEFGDCSAPDASSAGGHYNPTSHQHGAREDEKRHAGDFGNIEANEQGEAKIDFTDKMISFEGETSILGRAVIVHAKADDLKSQPSGNAGDRVACGVIGVANPGKK